MIDALIFDFDGVIIDTETPNYLTWQEVFESYGVELDHSLWSRIIGGGTERFDPCQHLEDLTGAKLDQDAIRQRRGQRHLDVIESSPLLPGVLEYISEARRLGLKLGVASSSSRDWVESHLVKRDLLEHFDAIVARDDVDNIKPDPELYLTAVAHLGVSPHNALAIEDSPNGITAAKRAGLFCVVVPNQMTRELPIDHADLRLETLTDIPFGALLEKADAG